MHVNGPIYLSFGSYFVGRRATTIKRKTFTIDKTFAEFIQHFICVMRACETQYWTCTLYNTALWS